MASSPATAARLPSVAPTIVSTTTTRLPQSLLRYILMASGLHQIPLAVLSIIVFLLEVVPLELQRRTVNDIVKHRPYVAIAFLCAAYAGTVLLQGTVKLALNIYRGWVGERVKRDLRQRIYESTGASSALLSAETQGVAASMVVAEVEPIGGFIGGSLSEPLLQVGVLATVIAYIVHLDAWMGVVALALFVPQFVFVPLMQHAMNTRTGARVAVLRQIGADVIAPEACDHADAARIERVLSLNMQIFRFKFTMNFLMNACSHLQIVAALLLGGWWVLNGQLEIGGIVAFISAIGRLNDPWGDIVNSFREASLTKVRFRMVADVLNRTDVRPETRPILSGMARGDAA
jgi:ABC-type multidrug transport system fused ATPase/permease subunit